MDVLQNRVRVFVCVPEQVSMVAQFMAKKFGGATVQPGTGYWYDHTGKCHKDHTNIITSYTDQNVRAEDLSSLLDWMFRTSNEQAIAVETLAQGMVTFYRQEFVSLTETA